MLTWYLPTFHGDIKLESTPEGHTALHAWSLTDKELSAMERLRERAISRGIRKQWAKPEAFPPVREAIVRTEMGMRVVLEAPIAKVQEFLSKALKPDKQLLSVVRFTNGAMEEVRIPEQTDDGPAVTLEPATAAAGAAPAVATTVARPDRGCPLPEFVKAELRANRVLEAFLNPDQVEDFRRRNQFVTVGQDTGHRYMVTSRLARNVGDFGGRSLFDMDSRQSVCVHDYSVPAAEEMLTLHLFLSLPGWETWMLQLPHD